MSHVSKIIIAADQDVANLINIKNWLSDLYSVLTVPSAKTLFLLLENIKPDLILLAVEMPDKNGFEILKDLKKSERTAHIPVIFLASGVDSENTKMGLDMGAADMIAKPFSREFLSKRIRTHLHRDLVWK